MTAKDVVGKFSVVGTNQDDGNKSYKGTLLLTLNENERINAKWIINQTQQQYGTGFFKNNILVINFNYLGTENKIYKGVVVYKCITKDILEGFWSEEFGDPKFLGSENCFRIQDNKLVH